MLLVDLFDDYLDEGAVEEEEAEVQAVILDSDYTDVEIIPKPGRLSIEECSPAQLLDLVRELSRDLPPPPRPPAPFSSCGARMAALAQIQTSNQLVS